MPLFICTTGNLAQDTQTGIKLDPETTPLPPQKVTTVLHLSPLTFISPTFAVCLFKHLYCEIDIVSILKEIFKIKNKSPLVFSH